MIKIQTPGLIALELKKKTKFTLCISTRMLVRHLERGFPFETKTGIRIAAGRQNMSACVTAYSERGQCMWTSVPVVQIVMKRQREVTREMYQPCAFPLGREADPADRGNQNTNKVLSFKFLEKNQILLKKTDFLKKSIFVVQKYKSKVIFASLFKQKTKTVNFKNTSINEVNSPGNNVNSKSTLPVLDNLTEKRSVNAFLKTDRPIIHKQKYGNDFLSYFRDADNMIEPMGNKKTGTRKITTKPNLSIPVTPFGFHSFFLRSLPKEPAKTQEQFDCHFIKAQKDSLTNFGKFKGHFLKRPFTIINSQENPKFFEAFSDTEVTNRRVDPSKDSPLREKSDHSLPVLQTIVIPTSPPGSGPTAIPFGQNKKAQKAFLPEQTGETLGDLPSGCVAQPRKFPIISLSLAFTCIFSFLQINSFFPYLKQRPKLSINSYIRQTNDFEKTSRLDELNKILITERFYVGVMSAKSSPKKKATTLKHITFNINSFLDSSTEASLNFYRLNFLGNNFDYFRLNSEHYFKPSQELCFKASRPEGFYSHFLGYLGHEKKQLCFNNLSSVSTADNANNVSDYIKLKSSTIQYSKPVKNLLTKTKNDTSIFYSSKHRKVKPNQSSLSNELTISKTGPNDFPLHPIKMNTFSFFNLSTETDAAGTRRMLGASTSSRMNAIASESKTSILSPTASLVEDRGVAPLFLLSKTTGIKRSSFDSNFVLVSPTRFGPYFNSLAQLNSFPLFFTKNNVFPVQYQSLPSVIAKGTNSKTLVPYLYKNNVENLFDPPAQGKAMSTNETVSPIKDILLVKLTETLGFTNNYNSLDSKKPGDNQWFNKNWKARFFNSNKPYGLNCSEFKEPLLYKEKNHSLILKSLWASPYKSNNLAFTHYDKSELQTENGPALTPTFWPVEGIGAKGQNKATGPIEETQVNLFGPKPKFLEPPFLGRYFGSRDKKKGNPKLQNTKKWANKVRSEYLALLKNNFRKICSFTPVYSFSGLEGATSSGAAFSSGKKELLVFDVLDRSSKLICRSDAITPSTLLPVKQPVLKETNHSQKVYGFLKKATNPSFIFMNNQTVPFFRNRLLLKLKTLKPWYNKLNAQHRKISTFSGQLEPSFSGFQTAQDSPFASPFNISRLVGSNFLSSPLNTKANTFNIRDPRRKRMSESTGQTSSNSFPTLKIVDRTTKQSKTLTRLLKRHHKLKETKILTLSLSLPNAPVRKHFRAYPRPFWENYKLYNKFLTKRMAILNDSSRQNRQIPRVIPISLSQAVGVQSNPNLPVFKKASVGAIHSVIQSFSDSVFLPGGVKNRLQQKGLDTTPMRSFVSSAIPLVLDSRSPSGQKQQARKIKKKNVFMHFTSLPSFGGVESMGQPWLSDPAMSETSKLMNLKTLPSSKPNGVLSSSFAGIKKEQPFLKKGGWWSSTGELSKNKPLTEVQKIYYKKRDLTEDTGINQASFSIPTLQQNYMIKSNYSLLWSLKKTNITFQNAASNKYNIWLFPKTRIDTIRKKHAKAKATIRKIKNKVSNQGIQVLLNLRTKARNQLDFASNLTDINTKNTKMWKFPLFSIHKKLTNLYNKNYFLTDNSNSSLASAPIRAVDVIQSHMPKNLSGEFLLPEPLLLKKSRRLVSPTRRNGTYKCTQNHFLSSSNMRGSFYQNWILPTLSNPLKSNSNLCQKQCNQINRLVNLIPNKLMKIIPGSIEVKSIFNSQFSQMSSPPYGVAYADKTRDTRMTGVFNNRVSLPNCFEINPLLYSYAMFIFFNLYFFLFVIKLAPVRLFFKLLFILSVSILRGITIIQTLGWAYSSKVLEYGKKLGVMQSFSNSVFLLPQKVSLKNRLPLWGLESSAMSVLKRRALQTDLFVAGQRLQGSNFNFQSTLDLRKQKTTDKPNQSPLLNRHLRLKGNLVPAILRIPFTAGLVSDSASGAFLTASFAGIKKTKPRAALFNWRSFDRPNKLMKPGLMPSLPQPFVTSFLFQEKSQSLPNRESRAFSLMQGNQPLLFMLKSNSATNSYSSHSSKNAANTFGNTFSALWKLEKIYFQKSLASFSIKIIDKGLFLLSPIKQFYDRPYAYIYDLIATTFGLVEYTANLNNRIPQKLFVNFFSFLKKMSHAIMLYPQELSLSKDFLGFDLGSSNTLSTFGEFPRLDSGFKTPLAFNDGPQSVSSILLRAASKNEAPTRLSFFSAFFSSFLSINMRIFIQKRLQNLIYKIVEELNQPDSELILNQQSYIAALNILTKVSISRNQNIDSLDFNHLITTLDESTAESNKKPQSKISNPVVSKNKIFRFLPFSQIKEGGIPAKNETMLTTKHPSWKVDKFMFSDKPLLHSLKQKTLFELQRAPSAYIGSFNNSIIFSNVKSSIESCRKKKSSSQWYLDQRISFLMNSTIFSTSLVDYHIPKNLTILSSLPANQNVTQKFELLNSLRGFFESTSSLSPELFPNLSLGGNEDLRFWSSPPLSKTKKVGLGADSDLQNGPIEFFDPNPNQKASDSIQTGINSVAKLLFSRRLFNSALRLKKKMQLLSPEIYGGLTGLIDLGYSLSIQNQEPVPGNAASFRRLASWSGFSLLAQRSNETTRVDSGQTMARIQANSFVQSTTNNGLITCSAYTSLTPENLYPANAYQRPESINKNVNTGFLGGVTLSNIMCEVFSGLFEKQTAKNVLVIGPPELGKRLLIQAIAGETELKMISDDAAKYSSIEAGVATGVKLLRGIFESLPLYTPCLFLLEDIHLIGERRSDMLSSSQSRCDKHSLSLPLDLQQERDDVEHQEKLTASFNEINIHSRTKKGQETKDSSLNEYLSYCFNLFFSASRYNVNLKKAAPPFGTYLSSRPLPLALSMAWPLSQLGSQSSVLSQQLRMEPSNSRGSKLGDNNLSSNSLKGNSDLVSSLLRPRVLVDLVNLPEQFLDFSQRKKHSRLDSKYYPISPLNAKLTRFLPEYHTLYLFPRKIKEITTAKLCAPGSINTIKKSSQINSFFYTVIKETPIIQLSRLHFVNSQNNSGNIAEFNNNQAARTNSQYLKKTKQFFQDIFGSQVPKPHIFNGSGAFFIPVRRNVFDRRNKGAVKDKKQNSTATAHKMEKSIPESRMKIVKTSNHSSVYLQDNLEISTIQNGRSDLHKTSSLLHSRKSFEFSQQSKNPSLPAIMEIQRASILRPELMGQSTSKILQLANLALGQLNAKVDMITDLLMIIDNVRTSRGFIVFATTHIPYVLDPALRRPGRLDETIYIPQFSSFAGKASEPSNKISLMLCSSYPLRDARKAPSVADGGLAPQFILRGQSLETPSIIGSGGLLIGGVANKNGATAKTTEQENKLSTKSNSTRATDIFLHTTKTRLIPSFRPANLKKASIQSSRQNKTLFSNVLDIPLDYSSYSMARWIPEKANGSPFLLLGSTPGSFSIRTQGDANLLARIPDSPQVWRSTPKERTPLLDSIQSSGGYSLGSSRSSIPKRHKNSQHNKTVGKLTYVTGTTLERSKNTDQKPDYCNHHSFCFIFNMTDPGTVATTNPDLITLQNQNLNKKDRGLTKNLIKSSSSIQATMDWEKEFRFSKLIKNYLKIKFYIYTKISSILFSSSLYFQVKERSSGSAFIQQHLLGKTQHYFLIPELNIHTTTKQTRNLREGFWSHSTHKALKIVTAHFSALTKNLLNESTSSLIDTDKRFFLFENKNLRINNLKKLQKLKLIVSGGHELGLNLKERLPGSALSGNCDSGSGATAPLMPGLKNLGYLTRIMHNHTRNNANLIKTKEFCLCAGIALQNSFTSLLVPEKSDSLVGRSCKIDQINVKLSEYLTKDRTLEPRSGKKRSSPPHFISSVFIPAKKDYQNKKSLPFGTKTGTGGEDGMPTKKNVEAIEKLIRDRHVGSFGYENLTALQDPIAFSDTSILLPFRRYENYKRSEIDNLAFIQNKLSSPELNSIFQKHQNLVEFSKLYVNTKDEPKEPNGMHSYIGSIHSSASGAAPLGLKTKARNDNNGAYGKGTPFFLSQKLQVNPSNPKLNQTGKGSRPAMPISKQFFSIHRKTFTPLNKTQDSYLLQRNGLYNIQKPFCSSLIRASTKTNNQQRFFYKQQYQSLLTDQWWNGQLSESTLEATFLSDIDWRYNFIAKLSVDLIIDFPTTEQYYNPRDRNWVHKSSISYWDKKKLNYLSNKLDQSKISDKTNIVGTRPVAILPFRTKTGTGTKGAKVLSKRLEIPLNPKIKKGDISHYNFIYSIPNLRGFELIPAKGKSFTSAKCQFPPLQVPETSKQLYPLSFRPILEHSIPSYNSVKLIDLNREKLDFMTFCFLISKT